MDAARWLWRRTLPPAVRAALRRWARDLPHRLRDAIPDLRERLTGAVPLPPARLRARVGLNSSRREFLEIGGNAAGDILGAVAEAGGLARESDRWLDFGCGSGRVARHLIGASGSRRLTGVDVDRGAIAWCSRHLPGDFRAIGPKPPLSDLPGSYDRICAVSVLTHMDEPAQRVWIAELRRLLRVGGLLIVTTHSPDLTWTRPDLTDAQRRDLSDAGFLFAPAAGPFNDSSTFQSEEYLRRAWAPALSLRLFRRFGLGGYQDLSVWERPPGP